MHNNVFKLATLLTITAIPTFVVPNIASAATLQAITSLETGRYLDGINLTDNGVAIAFTADWNFNNGAYIGGDCYSSTNDNSQGIKSGCDFNLGYFAALNANNALSLQLTRHEYSRGFNGRWEFEDLTANWHINRNSIVSISYASDWLNRGFDSLTLRGGTKIALADRIKLNLSTSVLTFENDVPVSSLVFGKASLSYTRARWTAEAGFIVSDQDSDLILPFDVDQPDFSVSFSYRLY